MAKIQTSINLTKDIRKWLDTMPRSFNFSELIRDLIENNIDIKIKGKIVYKKDKEKEKEEKDGNKIQEEE